MTKRAVLPVAVIILIALLVSAFRFMQRDEENQTIAPTVVSEVSESTQGTNTKQVIVETVAEGLFVPWSIVFTSKDRVLVTERDGKIRVIEDGKIRVEPLITVAEVVSNGEEGLMGMALDPAYTSNKYIYICYAYTEGNTLKDKVVRLKDNQNSITFDKEILLNIPAAKYHAGCRLKFGPDNKLYATTGDAGDKNLAQNLNSLGGKILRLNSDGTIPDDNPYPKSYVYSYGHRNPQGIAWDSTGTMYSTEHGPSGFDGKPGGDELNKITKGANYGWPLVSHDGEKEGTVSPLLTYTPAVAPASLLTYSGKLFAEYTDSMFFGGLRGEGMFRVFTKEGTLTTDELEIGDLGRIREVVESPNGEIWFSTSNRDGRGKTRNGDDKIYRLILK
jgi:glucose/arabinose dehydrogenase